MLHLGDITKISGYSAPIVDCIIGGSPCQDLSVAGKRAGLDGERSGLYIEQVRIVKEMRERDKRNGRSGVDIRPRYMVWENVPGAFSSNKGDDFRIVLEEIAKVCDKDAVIPMPDNGKWTTSGAIVADGWSVAWRVLDAQYWGVPQRRRRIALVADFGGQSAPEILFVRKSLSGHSEQSNTKRQESSSDASGSLGADDIHGVDIYNTQLTGDKACPLTAGGHTSTGTCPKVMTPVTCYDIGEARLRTPSEYKDLSPTLSARCGTGGNNTPAVVTFEPGIASREGGHIYEGVSGTLRANAGDNQMATAYTLQDREGKAGGGKGALIAKELSATLRANNAQYLFQPLKTFSKAKRAQSETDYETWRESETANTLNAFDTGDIRTSEAVVYALDRASFNQGKNAQFDFEVSEKGVNSPIVAKGPGAVCYSVDQGGGKSSVDVREDKAPTLTTTHDGAPAVCYSAPARTRYIVRRLTPLECERLQGYPDGWTDIGEYIDSTGKKRQTSDAARYRALGNSIALPPWKWILKRISACYERDATMASLFDGIGGFPHLWEQLNGKGSCLWASEIEEFPMAVTKVRIGGDT